jgi:flagellar biosynthesis protein FliQ
MFDDQQNWIINYRVLEQKLVSYLIQPVLIRYLIKGIPVAQFQALIHELDYQPC